jgi:hypothetical protein
MRVIVFLMRKRGRRLASHGDVGIAGELRLHSITSGTELHTVAQLCARIDRGSRETELLPSLYAPQLVAVGTDSLLLRGFEPNDGAAHVQEWHCKLELG